jgi:hypothetical protein
VFYFLQGLVQFPGEELVEAPEGSLEKVSNLILFFAEILDLRGVLDPACESWSPD